ncbi:MAG: 1-deoxy-D-xylulose-5-phosphate synthase [Acidimicrobiia bacterium]|nr:1-deoxy-D-xylulose-5-phosphate synthase [Acidimicrobiia bacterium]
MLLDSVSSPADLRGLSYKQLDELSREIRDVIIAAVAKCGGHLGSNLGAVEVTLALHRVFSSPRDVILWDTGHLAYPHKIVTGRRDGFEELRQANGLSGYPNRAESEHDWVENSHASTILGYADGFAFGKQLLADGKLGRIVAVIGDGSMTGGMAYEGLNNLGHSGRKAIIILNDNGRSYAPTISRLAESVARIRLNPSYLKQRTRLERLVRDVPVVGDHLAWGMAGAFAGMREMFEPPVFFESLGVRYTGPFDGHDVEGLERALRHAATYDGPIVVHVLTQKGRGYPPAEEDDEQRLHDSPVFDLATGPGARSTSKSSYTQAFSEAIIKEGELRPELVAITAAMPGSTGLLPFQDRFPDRMVDVGIAEQHAVTSAAGMAMAGLRPVVAIYSTFLTRAFDQANLDVGLHDQPVVFCLDRAGITGDNGASHHGVLDLVLMTKIPGMTVFAPSSYQELQVMLHDALDITSGPVTIRWPNGAARVVGEDEIGHGLSARKVRGGDDLAIVGVGKLLAAAEQAAEELASEGLSVTVWDPRVVKPLDDAMLEDLLRFDRVLTAEDGYAEGGIGAQLSSALVDRAITAGTRAPMVRALGVPVRFIPQAKPDDILSDLGLDGPGLAAEGRRLLGR